MDSQGQISNASAEKAGDLCSLLLHPSCMSVTGTLAWGYCDLTLGERRRGPPFTQGYLLLLKVESLDWSHFCLHLIVARRRGAFTRCCYVDRTLVLRKSSQFFVCSVKEKILRVLDSQTLGVTWLFVLYSYYGQTIWWYILLSWYLSVLVCLGTKRN